MKDIICGLIFGAMAMGFFSLSGYHFLQYYVREMGISIKTININQSKD